MSNDVFANGREISCKAADGKTICAFPDVCMTPPENPVTPPGVPVPYPNTAFAKDTTNGSKSVKITKKEVMLKNKSYFKTSTGDEAGCAAKKGVITSKIKGKAYFKSWSMDVKVEGKNVVRHLDLTTHNHASEIGNESLPMPHTDSAAPSLAQPPDDDECKKLASAIWTKCTKLKERIADLEVDKLDLFNIAKSRPHPSLPKGSGSWDGHIHQAEGVQNGLRNNVEAYDEAECKSPKIPKSCRDLGYAKLPSRPKK